VPRSETARIAHFGIFEIDLQSGELRRNGLKVKLQEQPFQILALLLEHPGEVVTREELRRTLWAADTFVDFEHGLNAAIKRLRVALGDSAETPVFIQTLPKRGYRFLAPIHASNDASAGAELAKPPLFTRKSLLNRRFLLTLSLLIFVPVALFVGQRRWGFITAHSVAVLAPSPKIVPFTSFPGVESDPAFSPDGKQIAFVWDGDSGRDTNVYVKFIGGEKPLQISKSGGSVYSPAWSPDGHYVAFERCSGGPCGSFLVPALGGAERKLSDKAAGIGLSWSSDGKLLVFSAKDSAADPFYISLLSLGTLERRHLSSPPAGMIGDYQPSFSPDGKTVAFNRISSPMVNDIYVTSVDGGEARRVTFDQAIVDGITWTFDGRSVVFASNRAGGETLWMAPISGGTPERLSVGGTTASQPTISRNGDALAYRQGFSHANIWSLELDASGRSVGLPRPLIVSTSWDGGPQFSPDGSKIVFQSARSGSSEVWVANADGSDPVQLTSHIGMSGTPRWSPDGKFIAFDSRPNEHSHIFVVPAMGGSARQLTDGNFEDSVPSWSRDGRWIYFTSNRVGTWQLFKVPDQRGESIQVTKKGGFAAFESLDGQSLYFCKDNDYGIWKMTPPGAEETRILPLSLDWGEWAVATRGIYFVDPSTPEPTINLFDFATRRISRIAKVERSQTVDVPAIDVSPDGRTIAFLRVENVGDIVLVENFH
jgi:Tol biopolymer transport system component/DNA-binding winged helix-turn-helix (wHTH) protein